MSLSIDAGRRQERRKLAPAFVVTVGLALAVAACGGNVDDGSGPGISGAGASGPGGTGGTSGIGGSSGSSGRGSSSGQGAGNGGGAAINDPACPAERPTDVACTGNLVCSYPSGGGASSACPPSTAQCLDGRWLISETSCNPPPPNLCPDDEIVAGGACSAPPGYVPPKCARKVGACDVVFECQGIWTQISSSCGPKQPPPPCPAKPAPGGGCSAGQSGPAPKCTYLIGTCTEEYHCGSKGKWELLGDGCSTPVDPACDELTDEQSCLPEHGCRWLVPGCASDAETVLPKAGCFRQLACETDAECGANGSCQSVVYNPCAGKPCAACGAGTNVCVPK